MNRRYILCTLTAIVLTVATHAAHAQPVIKYITPDAAAPGMTLAIEMIGDYSKAGGFVGGGLTTNFVKLVDPADSTRVVLGPQTISWDGRLVQFIVFVKRNAAIGTVGLTVAGAATSVNLSIVDPLDLGILTGNRTITAGQSQRNTIVVDSLVLSSGTFTFPRTDIDPGEPGNQAYLPLRILSIGPIRLNQAVIDVSGSVGVTGTSGGNGGPGGGGGGGGMPANGGDGYTGGGGVGEQTNHSTRHGGIGTDGGGAHYYDGSSGLSGVPGGEGTEHGNPLEGNDEGGGGGTGHPFGKSGSRGVYKLDSPPGGYGAGSGGGTSTTSGTNNYGGGGGAFAANATQGEGAGDNSGQIVGNACLVPLAGGSGGAAGNVAYAAFGAGGSGGGGGGAIELTSFSRIEFESGAIIAIGGDGSNGTSGFGENGAGGGGGSGGAVVFEARDSIIMGSSAAAPLIDVHGGAGGSGYKKGGNGSVGRVRLDGYVSSKNGNAQTTRFFTPSKDYAGPSIQHVVFTGDTLRAYGNSGYWDSSFHFGELYVKHGAIEEFILTHAYTNPGSHTATWESDPIPLQRSDTEVYLAIYEDNMATATSAYRDEPRVVWGHMSGFVAHRTPVANLALSIDTLDFGVIQVGACKDSFVTIRNTGTLDLTVTKETIGDARFTALDALPITVAAGTSDTLHLRFCPTDSLSAKTTDQITSNSTGGVKTVVLRGGGKLLVASSTIQPDTLDFGKVRVGACKDSFIVVRSTGEADLRITRESIADTHFTVLDALPMTIAAGATDTLHLRFCPTDTSRITSSDQIESNASQSPQQVVLIGKGIMGILAVQTTLDFGNVPKGTCKDSTLYVYNRGNDSLTITADVLSNPKFTAISPSLPITLSAYDSARFTYRYCSTDTGSETSSGTIVSEDSAHFTLLAHTSLSLVTVDSLIDLGCLIVDSVADGKAYVRNVGNGALTGVTASVAPGSGLQIITNPSSVVQAHSIDSVVVELTASATGNYSGTVHIGWDANEETEGTGADIHVVAHVSEPPKIEVLQSGIDFGVIAVDSSSADSCFTITNYSCRAITADNIVISGSSAFSVRASGLPVTLADSALANVCVYFAPTKSGADSAYLSVVSGGDTSAPVVLRGSGLGPVTPVVLVLDTIYGAPGDVVTMHASVLNDILAGGVTSMTFRIVFDPMQLDLRTPQAVQSIASSVTVTDVAHSLGDHEITVKSSSALSGMGVIASLPFEILLPTANTATVSIVNASFGASRATLSGTSPGMVSIEQCDTTERIQLQQAKMSVSQNAPNPFNPRTTVRVDVQSAGYVTVRVLNVLGEEIARPFEGELGVGVHPIVIDGSTYPSGAYRYVVDWTDGNTSVAPIARWMTVSK